MTKTEQINDLNNNVKCKIGPSKIHGVGVIAIRKINKGEQLHCKPKPMARWYDVPYSRFDEIVPEIREIILQRWASVVNGSHFLSPNEDAIMLVFMNHSDNPNYDVATDCAIKDIAEGEEVLEDYRRMANWVTVFPWLKIN